MKPDKELQCDLLEWFLCCSDADCGLRSSIGPQLAHAEAGAYVDDGTRHVKVAPREEYDDYRTNKLASSWATQEDELREFYKSFGIGVTMPSDLGARSTDQQDPYDSSQCDFSEKTKFAKARSLYRQWRELPERTRRVLLAHYSGMNPTEASEVRTAYQTVFEHVASVAYWLNVTIPLGDEFSEGDRIQKRIDVDKLVREAHREWYSVGQRLAAAKTAS